jgi:predicted membrane protein
MSFIEILILLFFYFLFIWLFRLLFLLAIIVMTKEYKKNQEKKKKGSIKSMTKCDFCGKEFKNQGSKNLHMYWCPKNPKLEEHQKKADIKNEDLTKNGINKNNGECKHEMIILNANNANQAKAIKDGYSAYCKKCFILI